MLFLCILATLGANATRAQGAVFVDLDGDAGIGDSTPDASLDIERDGLEWGQAPSSPW